MSSQSAIVSDVIEVMRKVGHLAKTEQNRHQNFQFRGIDGVMNAFGPALREVGVIASPRFEIVSCEMVKVGQKQAQMVVVQVTLTFVNELGEVWDAVTAIGNAMDYGDKGFSKAQSVALRQAYLYLFTLPTQEKDPDEFSYEMTGQASPDAGRLPDTEEAVVKMIGEAKNPAEVISIRERALHEGKFTKAVSQAIDNKLQAKG